MSDGEAVQVAVRCRPFNARGKGEEKKKKEKKKEKKKKRVNFVWFFLLWYVNSALIREPGATHLGCIGAAFSIF